MFKHFVAVVSASLFAVSALAQTEAAPAVADAQQTTQAEAPEQETAPEKILVVGQRPGPGLWKISKGDHVLWVFGTYGPIPQKMEWRSQQVEAIMAQSQEYLTAPSAKVGTFQVLHALPFAIGADKNPDGAKLKDVLPPDVYARWLPLKEKYIGPDDAIERRRPIFAAQQLSSRVMFKAGLSSGGEVQEAIFQLAKKNKLKITPTNINMKIESPVRAIRDFKKSSLDDVACLVKTMDRLETDIDAMRIRANAWAKGDLDAIRKLDYDRDEACHSAIMNSAMMKDQPAIQSMEARLREAWLTAAERSLATNTSTFATLGIKKILEANGVIAELKAKGYLVEAPE